MYCSMPGFPLLHHLLELAQTHIQSVMASNNRVLCHPLLLLISIFPSIKLFSNTPIGWLFVSGGQSIGSFSFSIKSFQWILRTSFLYNQLVWSPCILRVFSNTTVQKHHFFGIQPILWTNSHIHTWILEKP